MSSRPKKINELEMKTRSKKYIYTKDCKEQPKEICDQYKKNTLKPAYTMEAKQECVYKPMEKCKDKKKQHCYKDKKEEKVEEGKQVGKVEEDEEVGDNDDDPERFRACFEVEFARTSTGAEMLVALKGAVNVGLDVPHSEKRFPGYDSKAKSFKADVYRAHIFLYTKAHAAIRNDQSDKAKADKKVTKMKWTAAWF